MNDDHESELRRRLTASVPPPPAGLADRIKADIPDELFPARGVVRPSRSRFFPLQVAASLVVLASSAYMATRVLLTSDPATGVRTAAIEQKRQPPVVATADGVSASEPAVQAIEPAAPQVADATPPARTAAVPSASRTYAPEIATAAPVPPYGRKDEMDREETGNSAEKSITATANAAPPPAALATPAPAAPAVQAAEAGALAAARRQSPGTTIAQRAAAASGDATGAGADAPPSLSAPSTLFGISVDESSIAEVRERIGRGERPWAARVDSEAFASYFAGRAASGAAVSLDVEGSRSPATEATGVVLVRFTVDTARDGGSRLPVARDATIKLDLNSSVVSRYRSVGGEERLSASEDALFRDTSVTAVYELHLQPGAKPLDQVATIRLRYKETGTGHMKTIVKTLKVRDVRRDWDEASRRHRLATLGGLLGESMQAHAPTAGLAVRADELTRQEPRDERARQLAAIAKATGS